MIKQIAVTMLTFLFCMTLSDFSIAGHLKNHDVNITVSKRASGTLSAIDVNARTLIVKQKLNDKEVERKFIFDDKTKVMKGEEQKTIADLKTAEEVVVIYILDGNDSLARSIRIGKE